MREECCIHERMFLCCRRAAVGSCLPVGVPCGEVDVNSFLNETVPYEVQGLEAAMQYTVKSPRTWDDSMVRRFRKRPEFAVRMLNSCMEDGDQVAFLVTLRQGAKAFGGMAHVAEGGLPGQG